MEKNASVGARVSVGAGITGAERTGTGAQAEKKKLNPTINRKEQNALIPIL
jgi:hypothetical protein